MNKLPEDWEEVPILKPLKLVTSGVKEFNGTKTYISTGSLETGKIVGGENVTFKERPSRANMEVKKGDILCAKMMNTVKAFVVNENNANNLFSTGFFVFRMKDKDKVLPEYVFYYVRSPFFQHEKNKLSTGATQKSLTNNELKKIKIPLPPINQQREIVSILDEAYKLIQYRQEADHLTQQYLQSVFLDIFGDPLTNPKGWEMVKLNDVSKSRLGKMLDIKQQTGKHLKPYLRNTNVLWGYFDLADLLEMDFDEEDQKEFLLRNGDLIICEGGEVGRCAIWREEMQNCYFQKALHRLKTNQNMLTPEYLQMVLWFYAKRQGFRKSVNTSTISHLTGIALKRLSIPLPPVDMQNKYAHVVSDFEKLRPKQTESTQQINSFFNSLMQRAFRGELTC